MALLRRYLLLLLWLTFGANTIIAQHPYFYTINDEQGLPSNEVYQIQQDAFGYLWIGSDAGLFRYDGFKFKSYSNSRQTSASISNLTLGKNKVYCQNFTGQIFCTEGDSLRILFDAHKDSRNFPEYTIDHEDRIWISTDSLLRVLDANGKLIKKISLSEFPESPTALVDVEFYPGQEIVVAGSGGEVFTIDLKKMVPKSLPTEKLKARHQLNRLDNEIILHSELLSKKEYRVCQITDDSVQFKTWLKPLKEQGVHYYYKNLEEDIVLCTSYGMFFMKEDYSFDEKRKEWFPGKKISFSYRDKENTIWITSLQDGLLVIPDPLINVFNSENSLLNDNNISSLDNGPKGTLLIGTYSGTMFQLDPENDELERLAGNEKSIHRAVRRVVSIENKFIIARGNITSESSDDVMFGGILNNSRDLQRLNDTLFFIAPDRAGKVHINGKAEDVVLLRKTGGRKIGIDPSTGIVLFGFSDGLFVYENGALKEIQFEGRAVYVSDICFDGKQFVISTYQDGVFLFSEGKISQEISVSTDRELSQIKSLYADSEIIAMTTLKGLLIRKRKTGKEVLVNKYDGLAFKEINRITRYKDELFLATIKGLVRLPINGNYFNTTGPDISAVQLHLNNNAIPFSTSLELKHSDNDLIVDLSATGFRSRGDFKYLFRILPLNKTWQELEAQSPRIIISSLSPGNYKLEIIASNEDGVHSEIPLLFTIKVHPPFWQRWWFYLVIGIGFAALAAFFFQIRIRYIRRKADREMKVVKSQLTALKAQMNPHFMFNTLNSLQSLILSGDVKGSNYYLTRFSSLMRQVLQVSEKEEISLKEEMEMLQNYLELEKLRFGNDFEFEIKFEGEKDAEEVMIPSMLIQPFVENAVKHGLLHKKGQKRLRILFHTNALVTCIVEDNGIGRARSAEINKRNQGSRLGFSMGATEKRIELFNSSGKKGFTLQIDDILNKEESGTRVTITFPYHS